MLYGSSTIVLFYESFDTSYAYSRIGRLDAPDRLAEMLGAGDVTVTFAKPADTTRVSHRRLLLFDDSATPVSLANALRRRSWNVLSVAA